MFIMNYVFQLLLSKISLTLRVYFFPTIIRLIISQTKYATINYNHVVTATIEFWAWLYTYARHFKSLKSFQPNITCNYSKIPALGSYFLKATTYLSPSYKSSFINVPQTLISSTHYALRVFCREGCIQIQFAYIILGRGFGPLTVIS